MYFSLFFILKMQCSPRCNIEKFNSSHADDLGAMHRRESFQCNEDLNPTLLGAVAQWLRCCATNRKAAGSIPAGINGFFIDTDRTVALRSIQPLTEMSTRSISWG